jgi:hypothetical protein
VGLQIFLHRAEAIVAKSVADQVAVEQQTSPKIPLRALHKRLHSQFGEEAEWARSSINNGHQVRATNGRPATSSFRPPPSCLEDDVLTAD